MKTLRLRVAMFVVLLAGQLWCAPANAQVVTSGELVIADFDGQGDIPDASVDRITFYVTAGTTVNFDALILESPYGNDGQGYDLNGDGEFTSTDGGMLLFDADNNLLVSHDDGPRGNDGSITRFDGNFTYLFANAGVYWLAVGAAYRPDFTGGFVLTPEAALNGYEEDYAATLGLSQDHADWQITLTATGGAVSNIVVDTLGNPATPNPNAAPEVVCSVQTQALSPPNHKLFDVGLTFEVADDSDPDPIVEVLVFGNECEEDLTGAGSQAPDAVLNDTDRLWLRAEREGDASGRVYLIIVLATDTTGKTGFDCATVVVPHDRSEASKDAVTVRAMVAEAACLATGTAPDGCQLIGSFLVP